MENYFKTLSSMFGEYNVQSPIDYKDENPQFDVKNFFNGIVEGWGIVQDNTGKIRQKFKSIFTCQWQEEEGKIYEEFFYPDGSTEARTWSLKFIDSHHIEGVVDKVIGKVQGEVYGNAMRLQYRLDVPMNDKNYEFDFDDWMFMLPDDKVINRAKIKKFGFKVGNITIFLSKKF